MYICTSSSTSSSSSSFLSITLPIIKLCLSEKMGSEVKDVKKIVLVKPMSLDDTENYEAPNLICRILSLFKNIRPGSDLTSFQLPPLFNVPKSNLQGFGEMVYAVKKDMLKECNNGENPIERMKRVVAWSISITRPGIFGVVPFNPILGETHHLSRGSLNFLFEQISHHPPVTALHATDETENIEMIWCQSPIPKFYGTKVEAEVKGKMELKLKKHGETYVMNSPKILISFVPPGMHWIGNVKIQCQESGLQADLCYLSNSFLFGKKEKHRCIKGKIYHTSSPENILCEVHGHWDSIVKVKDITSGEESVMYNAKEVLCGLKSPIVKDHEGIWVTESAAVWSEVSEAIINKNWAKATEAKKAIEDKQRGMRKERKLKGEEWASKHFNVSVSKDGDWQCSPIAKCVPPAPIVVPL